MSESDQGPQESVTVLRDSASKLTLVLKEVNVLSNATFTGQFVVVKGFGGG